MGPEDGRELDPEIAKIRETLDNRYDEIVSGKVQLIDGEKARAMLKKRTEERRKRMTNL